MVGTGLCIKKRLYMGPLRIYGSEGEGFAAPAHPAGRELPPFAPPAGGGHSIWDLANSCKCCSRHTIWDLANSCSRHSIWDLAKRAAAGTVLGTLQTAANAVRAQYLGPCKQSRSRALPHPAPAAGEGERRGEKGNSEICLRAPLGRKERGKGETVRFA